MIAKESDFDYCQCGKPMDAGWDMCSACQEMFDFADAEENYIFATMDSATTNEGNESNKLEVLDRATTSTI